MKRPASTENDKEVKKAKLELENAITKKEIKDEKPINDQDIKKHLKQLTREVSKTFYNQIKLDFTCTRACAVKLDVSKL